ncbi:trans-sialidase [Trypanosoma cruzi]|nr:trans-sialidase [Trypanosoma cruzi]
MPSAVVSPYRWRSVQSSLVPSRAQACDTPRHGGTTSPLSGIGCAAVLLGLCLCSAVAAGNPLVRRTVRVSRAAIPTAACTFCARVPPGYWNMDWPFTPCAPDSAIRDCLPGMAPGPGGVLSAFLLHLVPAARCSH